ncbi:uncharacterized protein LOC133780136 [Humulus lupulus]|uniref:uncharacterized protein LOC133780136 n=1 Tax=Humulus lupulus TaxID=3486 RepID=UPI002B404F72|nr:uncharacterized protein LOC133780136 [Humulus lupulus]
MGVELVSKNLEDADNLKQGSIDDRKRRELKKLAFNINYEGGSKKKRGCGGVLVVWDTRCVKVLDSLVGNLSDSILVQAEGHPPWWFSGIYGSVHYGSRNEFWDEIAGLSAICGDTWCLGGDFNVVRRVEEKANSTTNTRSMKIFDELITEIKLVDPRLNNGKFTWRCVRVVSDHSPMILDSNPPLWGPGPFRFDNLWLKHKEFRSNFMKWWYGASLRCGSGNNFMLKLREVQQRVQVWSKGIYGPRKWEKQALERRISELDRVGEIGNWDDSLIVDRSRVKREWHNLVLEEERGNWLKLKCQWTKDGDYNSRLFHSILSARKSKNFISRIERMDGSMLNGESEIADEIVRFFSNLYSVVGRQWKGIQGIEWRRLSGFLGCFIERPFEEEEIKQAVFDCSRDKALGPDGFSLAVFHSNWDVIKDDLVEVFKKFHVDGSIPKGSNETYICLIPKKLNSCRVNDFRPISLVTSVYKIISKVLANRLKGVLSETISETQGVFVEGRHILDSVLVANEAVEEYRSKGKSGWVFKIDFEKAYDCVEWVFKIDFEKAYDFGFCARSKRFWRSLAKVDEGPRGKFGASRGLRQGDPLSPFLFTIVADVLGSLVDKAKASSALLDILKAFSASSGLQINLQKCQLLGLNVEEEVVISRASIVGCEVGKWQMRYLGLPLGDNPRLKSFWEPVMAECAKQLAGWKSDYNKGSEHLVAWNDVCKPLFQGGLGVGHLEERNKAFLIKWLWRFPLGRNFLWHKVVLSCYGRAENLWDTKSIGRFTARGPWKDISSLYGEYLGMFHFKVGRGDLVRFWEDVWIEGQALKDMFPNLAIISQARNTPIFEMGVSRDGGAGVDWDFRFRRSLFDREVLSLIELLRILEFVNLPSILDDRRVWEPDPNELFSCKSAF